MRSQTVHLPAPVRSRAELSARLREAGEAPSAVLAFLPPQEGLEETLAAMEVAWPESLRFGCEAVTQFAGGEMTSGGTVQLFWLDDPAHSMAVTVIAACHEAPLPELELAALAGRVARADGALLLSDGLRFPTERFLAALRQHLGDAPPIAGGLASQREPVTAAGARVFLGRAVLPSACLAVTLCGLRMQVEVVRGWSPASPVYEVTRAAGNVIFEIEGEPATAWYRRFFATADGLAPMPESANRFPLILEGPRPERFGLYRSMRFFDQPRGAVTFWGSVETGDRVRLGMGNDLSLVRTASELSVHPCDAGQGAAEAAILYSCVGRQMVLGEMAGKETASIHRALSGIALSGFFTFGEIGPTPRGELAFYNQTAVLVLLTEIRS